MVKKQHSGDISKPVSSSETKNSVREVKESLPKEGDNPVKQGLKKEQQPVSEGDLTSLNNNQQVGTTGGDQRASDEEIRQSFEPLESRTAKSAKDPKAPVTEDPNEDDFTLPNPENIQDGQTPVQYEPGSDGEPEKDYKEPGEEASDEIFE